MRAAGSGPFGALLMLAPLVAVPIFAVVGIPQFAPSRTTGTAEVDAGSDAAHPTQRRSRIKDSRVGNSARHDDDLFRPLDESDRELLADPLAERPSHNRADDDYGTTEGDYADEAPLRRRGRSDRDLADDSARREVFDEQSEPSEFSPRSRTRVTDSRSRLRGRGNSVTDNDLDFEGADFIPEETGSRSGSRGRSTNEIEPSGYSDAGNPFEGLESTPRTRSTPRRGEAYASNEPADGLSDAPPFEPTSPGTRTRSPRELPPEEPSNKTVIPFEEEAVPEEAPSNAPPATSGEYEFTWREAIPKLRNYGVTKHYFTYLEDQETFAFTCYIGSERVEAEAPEPLLAVRDVLQQLREQAATAPRATNKSRTRTSSRE